MAEHPLPASPPLGLADLDVVGFRRMRLEQMCAVIGVSNLD
ncbi:hypothetical protein ACGFIG_21835 [Micromonospora sp. NPDC049048]